MCNANWRGMANVLLRMQQLIELLTVHSDKPIKEKRDALEIALADLVASIDWFEWSNGLDVSPQRVEAEFNRYEEEFDDVTTQREGANCG